MMGRALLLLLVLVLAASPAEGMRTTREVHGEANLCKPISITLDIAFLPCPNVRHDGRIFTEGCEGAVCTLSLNLTSRGNGLPIVSKTLHAELIFQGDEGEYLCSTTSSVSPLSCTGSIRTQFELAESTCREIRVRTHLRDLAEVPPTIPVQADTGIMLCRANDQVDML